VNGNAGKGDKYRPVDRKKYYENYDRIFGKKKECQPTITDVKNATTSSKNQSR
jgi:hypothetical protein